jgi:G patch domain/KOW motif-containing protein
MNTLPSASQDYEAMPVEEFGKALLRGLGWADGQGVGRKRQVRIVVRMVLSAVLLILSSQLLAQQCERASFIVLRC